MIFDAVVLAGGRSSRLGGTAKAGLSVDGTSLLERTLAAATAARAIVVVGDPETVASAAPRAFVPVVREVPAFGGPAAAIAAGVDYLRTHRRHPSDFTLVLACDMPGVADAVHVLIDAVRIGSDGAVVVSPDGRVQPLVGLYSTRALANAAEARGSDGLTGASVRSFLGGLHPDHIPAPAGSTADIDTWDDARELGAHSPGGTTKAGAPVARKSDLPAHSATEAVLRRWCDALLNELDLPADSVDVDAVLALAGTVAHSVVRPAAPLTAYLVGIAVGRATYGNASAASLAFEVAEEAARTLAETDAFAPVSQGE